MSSLRCSHVSGWAGPSSNRRLENSSPFRTAPRPTSRRHPRKVVRSIRDGHSTACTSTNSALAGLRRSPAPGRTGIEGMPASRVREPASSFAPAAAENSTNRVTDLMSAAHEARPKVERGELRLHGQVVDDGLHARSMSSSIGNRRLERLRLHGAVERHRAVVRVNVHAERVDPGLTD